MVVGRSQVQSLCQHKAGQSPHTVTPTQRIYLEFAVHWWIEHVILMCYGGGKRDLLQFTSI